MNLEVKPSSPSRPTATPAKIDIRSPKPTSAAVSASAAASTTTTINTLPPNSPRSLHSQHSQHDQHLQLSRGDDSPISPVALSLSLTRRDMDQLRSQSQSQSQSHHSQPDARDSPLRPIDNQLSRQRRQLPPGCKISKMVGEGAANAVFEFTLPGGGHLKHQNTRLLLRVAKSFEEDDRPRFDYLEQYRYYLSRIKPILGSYVLHQELVHLGSSGIIKSINDYLRSINSTRTPKFRDSWVEESDLGFLVEDMRPDDPSQSLLVEFKPKWLSQSPSAPNHAIRCRQCAKELHSYVTDPGLKRPVPTQAKPCPLTLSRDNNRNQSGTDSSRRLVPHIDQLGDDLSNTLDVLRDEEAFECLRSAQEENDGVGPLGADTDDYKFALAMTLRDCTCFAVVSTQASRNRTVQRPLKVRFGDFDMKIPEFRLDYWRRVEEELIEGGFYTASWIYCNKAFYAPPTNCVLESTAPPRRHSRPEIIHLQNAEPTANGDGSALFRDMSAKLGRSPVVHTVDTDVPTLETCLATYKRNKPTLKRPRQKQEAESWLSASCRQF